MDSSQRALNKYKDAGVDDASVESEHKSVTSLASTVRRTDHTRFIWKNTWEFMVLSLAFTTTPSSMWSFVEIKTRKIASPNIIQYLVTYMFVGMPLAYMMVIVGNYSQMGLIHLKFMCPIGHGVGYVCLIIMVIYIAINNVKMADAVMYLLTTLQHEVQWMICPKGLHDECWSGVQLNDEAPVPCNGPCLNSTVHLSTHWYWNNTYMSGVNIQDDQFREIGKPSLPRVMSTFFCTILIFCMVAFVPTNSRRKVVAWFFYVSFIMAIFLLFGIGGIDGARDGLVQMFDVDDITLLYSMDAWSWATAVVMKNLCLGRACQLVFGSFHASLDYAGMKTLLHVVSNFIVTLLLSMITYFAIGGIAKKAHLDFDEHYMTVMYNSRFTELSLIVVPQSIGFKYAPQFWNILYFGMQVTLLLSNQILLTTVFVKCIYDRYSNLLRYRKYIVCALSIFTLLVSLFLLCQGIYLLYNDLRMILVVYLELLVVTCMSIIVFYIYGVKRLSDDLHFTTGQQPTKFWKIFWILNPVILVMCCFRVPVYADGKRERLKNVIIAFLIAIISPLVILGCFQLFKYLKKRNLVGLIQPEESWGPPDPEERNMRHVFNPRKEIKSRRRNETCQHKCLLGSKVLKKIIIEEAKLRAEMSFVELQQLSTKDIVNQVK